MDTQERQAYEHMQTHRHIGKYTDTHLGTYMHMQIQNYKESHTDMHTAAHKKYTDRHIYTPRHE